MLGVYILPLLLVQMIKTGVGNKILYLFPINNLNVQNILGILYSKDAFFFHSLFINIGFIFIFQLLIRVGMQLYCLSSSDHGLSDLQSSLLQLTVPPQIFLQAQCFLP